MKIKDLLDSEDKWCQIANARDADDRVVNLDCKYATRWCLFGAAARCYDGEARSFAMSLMVRAIERLGLESPALRARSEGRSAFCRLVAFNDNPSTTFPAIRKVLEEADV